MLERPAGGGDGSKMFFVRNIIPLGVDFPPLAIEFLFLEFPCAVEAAGADEFDDAAEFFAIEPHAVGAEDVDDDAGVAGGVGGGRGRGRAGEGGGGVGWGVCGGGGG